MCSLSDGSWVEEAVEDAIVPGLDVAFPAELSRVNVEEPSVLAVLAVWNWVSFSMEKVEV